MKEEIKDKTVIFSAYINELEKHLKGEVPITFVERGLNDSYALLIDAVNKKLGEQ